jgi:hypothetical protein
MSTKDGKHSLASKLAEVAREVAYVQKDATNSFQKYKYASAEAVLRKVNEALTSRNIAISSNVELIQYHHGEGKVPSVAIVSILLRFVDGDTSEVIAVQGLGQGADKGDKAVMKANTAALKYAYANAFTISWGDDPEADESIDKASSTRKRKSKKESGEFKTVFTREELETEVDKCTLLPELEKVRPKIITMRGTSNYDPLVTKYREKKKKLEEAFNGRS